MAYFVTGATGFIGRFLLARLLESHEGDIHVLVRESSQGKLKQLTEKLGAGDRVKGVIGDLAQPKLGIQAKWLKANAGKIEHVVHLAAIYDMTASDEFNEIANVGGTTHAVEVANALRVKHLHHVSSVAAAGMYKGVFTEDMFDVGQPLEHPYHRTKFEGEKIVRTQAEVPWRIYRPAIVIGDSKTGEMDKIDGPYYLFKTLKLASNLPEQLPLVAPKLGATNIVPVDYVADATAYLMHQDGLDGRAFHLVYPEPQPSIQMINTFAKAAGAPQVRDLLPEAMFPLAMKVPGVKNNLMPFLGVPAEAVDYVGFTATFDATKTEQALKGSGLRVPALDDYAQPIWDYWEAHLQ